MHFVFHFYLSHMSTGSERPELLQVMFLPLRSKSDALAVDVELRQIAAGAPDQEASSYV